MKIQEKDCILTNPEDIACAFSNFFSTVPNFSGGNDIHMSRLSQQSFYLFPTTPSEVRATIMNLQNCSPGLDSICSYHIKEIVDSICEAFSHVVYLIFKTGFFPCDLKRSKIIAVYKKGDVTLPANYGPISVLPCFSRAVEKLVAPRLSNYLDKSPLLTTRQFGFRAGYSTNLALITLTDKIKATIDGARFIGSVSIAYSKAFDSLNHNILFTKLSAYGITGPSSEVLRSYLHDRQQHVSI